jgi:acyl-CoA synthetase (AMP-forming)/AMP-acid ligase II
LSGCLTWGEAVTSAVVLREGGSATEEDLIKHGRLVFAGYPTPNGVLFFGDLPQAVGGKVLKYRLRAPRNMYGGIEADI